MRLVLTLEYVLNSDLVIEGCYKFLGCPLFKYNHAIVNFHFLKQKMFF